MQLNETHKMAIKFNNAVREKFGDNVDDFCILDVIDDPNHRAFSVEFTVFNYFPVRMNYDKGSFGCCIAYGKRGISLDNSQQWWDNTDFDKYLSDLQDEIKLRIPDKFLEKKGWK